MLMNPSLSSLTRLPGAARSRGSTAHHAPIYSDRPTTASTDLVNLNDMRDALENDANEVRSIVTLEHDLRSGILREERNLWRQVFLIPHDKEVRYFHHVYLAKQTRREAEQKHTARISALMLQSKSQHAEEKLKRREKREDDMKKAALAIQEQTAKQREERQVRQEVQQNAVDETTSFRRADVTHRMRNARLESILDKRSHATQQKQYLADESAQRVLARVDEKRRKRQLVKDVKATREFQSPSAFLRLPPLEKCAVAVVQRNVNNYNRNASSSSAPSSSSVRSRHHRNKTSSVSISYALVEDAEMKAVNRDVSRIWASWQASQGTQPQSSTTASSSLGDGGGSHRLDESSPPGKRDDDDVDDDILSFCSRDPTSAAAATTATTPVPKYTNTSTLKALSPSRGHHHGRGSKTVVSRASCSGGTQTTTSTTAMMPTPSSLLASTTTPLPTHPIDDPEPIQSKASATTSSDGARGSDALSSLPPPSSSTAAVSIIT
eukprot:TRINITY_DN8334_c0_g1_i3.p1 TRINITY_DN8334_c0_g1~~TRINITY_DN8334_c0_g1_i3.p1  ORF type:complete len:494 (-),score=70.84 TRINITY_DN8334_c0_g1_i3:244-1725(-)